MLVERIDLPEALSDAVDEEMRSLSAFLAGRSPVSIAAARQRRDAVHQLAEPLVAHAVTRQSQAGRRLAIRASVCAELVASGLTDYVGAFHRRSETENSTLSVVQKVAG